MTFIIFHKSITENISFFLDEMQLPNNSNYLRIVSTVDGT